MHAGRETRDHDRGRTRTGRDLRSGVTLSSRKQATVASRPIRPPRPEEA